MESNIIQIMDNNYWKDVGNRVKSLEFAVETEVPVDKCFIVRLDGCSFSKFTKGMTRPFDLRFTETMEKTTDDLVRKFHPLTGFCQSDEISLVFPECDIEKKQTHLYNGRVQKLSSILASYASVRFNHHIRLLEWDPKFTKRLQEGAFFDARLMIPKDHNEALDCILWRQQFDCYRNAVMAIAQHHFTHKQMYKVNVKKAIEMLLEKGIHVEDYPKNCLHGTMVKRVLVEKDAIDQKSKLPIRCIRTETCHLSKKDPIDVEYLFAHYG